MTERAAPRYEDVAALLARTTDLNSDGADLDAVLADLAALGLPVGSAVIIALSNGLPLLTQYFGALLSGLVPLAVSPATPSVRLAQLAEQVGAAALIRARVDRTNRAAVVGGQPVARFAAAATRRYRPGDVLMLTSGTSGMFSACLHEVISLRRNARRHATAVGLRAGDVVLVNLPLFYSFAIVAQAFAALVTGARLVLAAPPFTPAAYRAVIAEHAITASSVTPTIVRQLLARGDRLPPGLRMLTVGGDRLAAAQVSSLLTLVPGSELYVTYGLTEAGPRVSTLSAHEEPVRRHSSVGLPLAGVATSLNAPDVDGVGELLVHTDTALLRSVGESRRQSLVAPGIVATGDLFEVDGDGYHYFRGRLSNFAVIRGEKVSFDSVRQAAHSIPGVTHSAPRVLVDGDGETYFDLTVHVTDTDRVTPELIRGRLRSLLMRGEHPRSIVVVPADGNGFLK
ncbi:class I adenylate-forming enzyme family protein [Actinophytocola oryzae]|uniref:Acyl-CoA synthetase (AMP-forming)/AMP-acid ligase II n=1 Tax=Actinophytocola oryzae TaxID=502181 RepID=A0A4R7URS4_9PSEU|nr:class I adenylate-forming enzyme family protein [Actinophytocola oryzae]TDV37787.1 acyl-CoA synthetase (AMP-forming)/AMP-acid ligase II [Actinophytocola oryzae]